MHKIITWFRALILHINHILVFVFGNYTSSRCVGISSYKLTQLIICATKGITPFHAAPLRLSIIFNHTLNEFELIQKSLNSCTVPPLHAQTQTHTRPHFHLIMQFMLLGLRVLLLFPYKLATTWGSIRTNSLPLWSNRPPTVSPSSRTRSPSFYSTDCHDTMTPRKRVSKIRTRAPAEGPTDRTINRDQNNNAWALCCGEKRRERISQIEVNRRAVATELVDLGWRWITNADTHWWP